uniref:(northern house mosquito) hypothetical protein n=1 Tax=Culex pipiens TaxID=7175 RepID=A0A8D8AKT7_CULPI
MAFSRTATFVSIFSGVLGLVRMSNSGTPGLLVGSGDRIGTSSNRAVVPPGEGRGGEAAGASSIIVVRKTRRASAILVVGVTGVGIRTGVRGDGDVGGNGLASKA